MSFFEIFLIIGSSAFAIKCLIDGIKYYISKLFTNEPLDSSIENNIAGIIMVGFLISPLFLIWLIVYIITEICELIKKHSKQKRKNKPSCNTPKGTITHNTDSLKDQKEHNNKSIFLTASIVLFVALLLAWAGIFIYGIFLDDPKPPFDKSQHITYTQDDPINPNGNSELSNNNNNPNNNYNNSSTSEIQYTSTPTYSTQYGIQQTQIQDNSAWESYYIENYNRIERDIQNQYESLMRLGDGVENEQDHIGYTDNYLGNSKSSLILQMQQRQRELRDLRHEALQKYGIVIRQSTWENAEIH